MNSNDNVLNKNETLESPDKELEIKDNKVLDEKTESVTSNTNEVKQDDLLDKYFYDLEKNFKKVEQKSKFADYYYDVCNSGVNKFYLKNITETKMFDEEWIKTMEVFSLV